MKKIYGNERVIPFRPQLKRFFGSSNAALLYAQIEYWFTRNHGQSFYKFNAPYAHELYKDGDSLQEELAMTNEELETSLKRVCRAFKSKKEFDAAEDKFNGMPMCSYIDRINHLKYYVRNDDVSNYLNDVDGDDLPIFEDARKGGGNGIYYGLSNGTHCGLINQDITDPILLLYKRLQQKITTSAPAFSIAKSDTAIDRPTSTNRGSDVIASELEHQQLENVRKKNHIESGSYARIGISPERHDELKAMFEQFRIAYRTANGSVSGLEKEFAHLKKKHPKTWHEIVPSLLEKLKDQNHQREMQQQEEKFSPMLPMLSRYINEQMWDRHYYTPQKPIETKRPIANFTPDQLTPLHG